MKTNDHEISGQPGSIARSVATEGDSLERNHSEFILNEIPNYNRIWVAYIGNDGKNQMRPIRGLKAETEEMRKEISERIYTCLESVICLNLIVKKRSTAVAFEMASLNYLEFLNDLMAFHAHVGRIQDMVEKMAEIGRTGGSWKKDFNDFYAKRTVVLHGRKIPIGVYGEFFAIPSIAAGEAKTSWNERSHWDDPPDFGFEYFSEYIANVAKIIPQRLDRFLGMLYGRLKVEFGDKSLLSAEGSPFSPRIMAEGFRIEASTGYEIVPVEDNPIPATVSGSRNLSQPPNGRIR